MNKILISVPNDTLGGAEQYLKMIASYYLSHRYEVFVVFLKQKLTGDWENLQSPNLHLMYTKANSEKEGFLKSINLFFKLRKYHFQYIYTSHVHLTSLIGILIKLGIIKKGYFVGRESTSIFVRFRGLKLFSFKTLYALGYKSVDLLVCQTTYMRNQLIKNLPYLDDRAKVIPNPINLELSKNGVSQNISAEELTQMGDYMVSAGRLIPEKGFDILLKSFLRIKEQYNDLKLVILGDGPDKEMLEGISCDLKVNDSVIFRGFIKNVYPYFQHAKVCVVSSRIEGFPNVLLQMMTQNTKVVSTLCAGDIDKIDGLFTCNPNDENELTSAISECIETDTVSNRISFDKELDSRSIDQFIKTVNRYLNEK